MELMSPPALDESDQRPDALPLARMAIATAHQGIVALSSALEGPLGAAFERLVSRIEACRGHVVVTGMGKSGHIARKIAATLASTGTPALFVHPAEASHGDLGMIGAEDIVLALSWSGETPELRAVVDYCRRLPVFLAALTARPESALGAASAVVLPLPDVNEACPHNLAPTTSTLVQLALGDALAVTLLKRRGFTPRDFRAFHPGGKLGAGLRLVRDIMHGGAAMPLVPSGTAMSDALIEMSEKGFGCVGVTDDTGRLIGIITDGDLRRHMTDGLLSRSVDATMTPAPRAVAETLLASEALAVLNATRITALFVVDDGGIPLGILHVHDLLRLGIA